MNADPADLSWARTRRLVLREFAPDDQNTLVQMHRDPRVRELLIDDVPLYDPAFARHFIERLGTVYRRYEGLGCWHTTLQQPSPTFAGVFCLMPILEWPGEIEVGGRLLPSTWGQGIAAEGASLLLDHAFDRLGRSRVWGLCHPDNRSAQSVLASLGFESMGVNPYCWTMASQWRLEAPAWGRWRDAPRRVRLERMRKVLA